MGRPRLVAVRTTLGSGKGDRLLFSEEREKSSQSPNHVYAFFNPARIRVGVNGASRSRTPVASINRKCSPLRSRTFQRSYRRGHRYLRLSGSFRSVNGDNAMQ
jgi:hypothetical protein